MRVWRDKVLIDICLRELIAWQNSAFVDPAQPKHCLPPSRVKVVNYGLPRRTPYGLCTSVSGSGSLWCVRSRPARGRTPPQRRQGPSSGSAVSSADAVAERPGEVITREEFRQALWPPDIFVDFEQGISSAVMRLRDALRDSADNPIYRDHRTPRLPLDRPHPST